MLATHSQRTNKPSANPTSIPKRPNPVGFHLNVQGGIPRAWDCGDCQVDISVSAPPHTPGAQAWCVYNCAFSKWWPDLSVEEQNEMFLRVVNRWVQEELSYEVPPFATVCGAWQAAVQPLVAALIGCELSCGGLQTLRVAVDFRNAPCALPPGHISITPVQDAQFRYVLPAAPDDASTEEERTETRDVFAAPDWRAADDGGGACATCAADQGGCLRPLARRLSWGSVPFAATDIPHSTLPLVFGKRESVSALTETQLKQQWKQWNSDVILSKRIAHENRLTGYYKPCAQGVSRACLQNKGAVSGRACVFPLQCFTRESVFGAGYPAREDAAVVVRSRGSATWDGGRVHLNWFTDAQCKAAAGAQFNGERAFSAFRHSFTLAVPLQCSECAKSEGVGDFDTDTGARECGECFSPFVLELSLGALAGCPESSVFYRQAECDLHQVSLRRGGAGALRCVACRTLTAADGYARGSHRPLLDNECRQCVRVARAAASTAGLDAAGALAAVAATCLRCDDCRNCSASSTFDEVHPLFCRPLADMVALAPGAWVAQGRLVGADEYKKDEFTPSALDADHFRGPGFQQRLCTCNNRHKFAQYCGAYAVRDQDAWMTRDGVEELRLSLFTDAGMLARYIIKREGACQPCLACPPAHFNGRCVQGREGVCALCRALSSCTATPRPFLHHSHAEGCAQTHALSDYECRECPVWAKLGQEHMLLVGCGDQNLRRWTPTARAFDGVLLVGECAFEHGPGFGGAPASAVCRHAGADLQRQRPFGNYSALMPYCPPGWFFTCPDRATTAPWDPECCAKCGECPPEQSKNTAAWRRCSGAADYDSQASHCVDRCENNMYEFNNTCLFCTTCKEGEL